MVVYKSINAMNSAKSIANTTSSKTIPLSSFEEREDKNVGGLIGGVGYLGEKVAVGAVQSIEGISDYVIGGVAKLFGFDKFAERQFANDWFGDWYEHPDEWFNPGEGWKVAGDVAGGIGTSLPAMAVGLATMGAGSVAMGLATGVTAGLGAAGNATKEAYRETGKLTGKEFAYGALTGVVEGGMETVTNIIGLGSGAVIKSASKRLGNNVAKAAVRDGLAMTLAKSFIGEAFEEGVAEILSGPIKRATYDKDAENATWEEIAYASIVGGLSGVVMGGAGTVFSNVKNTINGNKLVNEGKQGEVLSFSEYLMNTAKEKGMDNEYYAQISDTYNKLQKSIEKTGGEITNAHQKRLLGELNIDNVASKIMPQIYKEAATIVANPELVAERLTSYNYKDADGKPMRYTKEQLLEGVDLKNLKKTLPEALKTNEALRNVVLASFANKMLIDASAFAESTMRGEKLAGEADLDNFLKSASEEYVRGVEEALGIEDLRKVSAEYLNERVKAYEESGALDRAYEIYRNRANGTAQATPTAMAQTTAQTVAENTAPINAGVDNVNANVDNINTGVDTEPKAVGATGEDAGVGKNADSMTSSEKAAGEAVANFIEEVNRMLDKTKQSKRKKKIGIISKNHADIINQLMRKINPNFSAEGYELWIDGTGAKHIEIRHGENGRADKSMATKSAKQRIPWAVQNAENGEFLLDSDGNIQLSDRFYNNDGSRAPEIRLEKSFSDDTIYVSECVPDSTNRRIYITSAYIKKGSKGQLLNMDLNKSPQPTPEASFDSNATNNSIPENSEIVKENSKKTIDSDKKALPNEEKSSSEKAETETRKSMTVAESAKFAQENVPEFNNLSGTDQARVRRVIRQAKANGFTDAQARAYARVSARSGIDIDISKDSLRYTDKDGNVRYADGLYSPSRNKIYVNPEGSRSPARVLIHELTHAIYKDASGKLWLEEGVKNLSDDEKHRILETYFPDGKVDIVEYADELNAHYTEALLDDDVLLEKLCDKNPTLEDKILSFFDKASKDYADEPTLSREAKKLYKKYKKLFEVFSEVNQYNTAKDGRKGLNADRTGVDGERFAFFDRDFGEQLNDWRDGNGKAYGRYNGKFFRLGTTPDVLTKHGAPQGEVIMFEDCLLKITGLKHSISLDELSKIPSQLNDPILLFKGNVENSFVALTEIENKLGHDVIVAVHIKKSLGRSVINKISSVYSKTNEYGENRIINYVTKQINEGKLLDASIKKAPIWFTASGLQLPHAVQTIIAASDSSISNVDKKVNPSDEKTSKNLSTNSGERMALPMKDGDRLAKSGSNLDNGGEQRYNENKNKGDDKNGQNTEVLGGRVLSAANRSRNDIRKQGQNTEEIFELLEKRENNLRRNEKTRLGSSGFLKKHSSAPLANRSGSLLRGLRHKVLSGKDVFERTVPSDVAKKFANTIFKDENGNLLSVYHWTQAFFDKFANGDIGFHFGTVDSAYHRAYEVREDNYTKTGKDVESSIFKEVYVNITNPVFLEADAGTWYSYTAALLLKDANVFSDADVERIEALEGAFDADYNSVAAKELRRTLESYGYDGIIYKNETEGDYSVIALYPDQIYTVAENGVEVHNHSTDRLALPATDTDTVDASDSVGKEKKRYEPSFFEKVFSAKDSIYIDTVNELYGAEKYLKKVGKLKNASGIVQMVRAMRSQAQTMIGNEQYDIFSEEGKSFGKGLQRILKPITVKGPNISKSFNEYLLHWLNTDRMTLEERTEGKIPNKPVFGENEQRETAITAEQSRKRIEELEKAHPDWHGIAEEVWAYAKNLNHLRAEAGLISADSEAYMNELYPHYVPAYRDFSYSGAGPIKGKSRVEINKTVRKAKGSGLDILDIGVSLAEQTQEVVKAGQTNRLFRAIYDAAMESGDNTLVEVVSRERLSREQSADMQSDSIEIKPKNNQITGFVDGERVTLSVSKEIFIAFDSISKPTIDSDSAIQKSAQWLNSVYKKLLTSYSPAFLLRNPIRDIQDAGLNTKHPIEFAKCILKAPKLMFQNSELWRQYMAYGGFSSTVFDADTFSANMDERGFEAFVKLFDSDTVTMKDVFKAAWRSGKNLLTGIENLNAFVEQTTRFAEFLASVEAGDSIQTAIYNSAEVSTNFGRRGRLTKKFNATVMPFLNPAIQGFDKMFRNVSDAITGEQVGKALMTLIFKAAAIGLVPMAVNLLLYGDDEDYEELREADKENNYLIKAGDTFIKIPRGRVASIIGGALNRSVKIAKGEDPDVKDYLSNVLNQVTPVQNLTRTIASPFFDVKNNLTWYGTAIEGREFENTAPKDRYDENTSSIAIAIGKVINYSPKKIHYLIDQYSGVIGDFVLPMTTNKAEKDFLSGNFTIDPATSNKLSTKFYKVYDKAQYAKTAGDDTAKYQVRYLNKVKKAISEMYDEKSEIQNSDLSGAEKLQQTRVVQILINEAYKTAMTDFEVFTKAIEATVGIEDEDLRYTEATRIVYGSERALSEYNGAVYEKCQTLSLAGIDYDSLYYYYFSTKDLESDKDKNGNTISGSKRKKVLTEINKLKLKTEQKLILLASKGYSLSDAEKKRVLRYIMGLKINKNQKAALAELCGFEAKNGKIIIK